MQDDDLPVSVLLARLSQELSSLQRMVAEMEASVDGMIARHAGALDAGSIRNLQLLDIVNQTLLALACAAANGAALSSPAWSIDARGATAGLTLAALAHRLAAGEGGEAPESGSYELFPEA